MYATTKKVAEISHTVYIDDSGEEVIIAEPHEIEELVKAYKALGYEIDYSINEGWAVVNGNSDC